MKLCAIASGSDGNCVYVGSDTTHILVDAGISGKRTELGLNSFNVSCKELDGILITHEHIDHICGLGVLSRKYHVPIYATKLTIEAIKKAKNVGAIDDSLFCVIKQDEPFQIKDLTCNPMKISHDAVDPVGFRISKGDKKLAIATDLGTYNDYTISCLEGMDMLYLEANHDVNMLQVGAYPYYLKQRILGDKGHLSNELSAKLLTKLVHRNLQGVMLGHLSKENNIPELAYETVRVELMMAQENNQMSFPIYVANKNCVSNMIHIA